HVHLAAPIDHPRVHHRAAFRAEAPRQLQEPVVTQLQHLVSPRFRSRPQVRHPRCAVLYTRRTGKLPRDSGPCNPPAPGGILTLDITLVRLHRVPSPAGFRPGFFSPQGCSTILPLPHRYQTEGQRPRFTAGPYTTKPSSAGFAKPNPRRWVS